MGVSAFSTFKVNRSLPTTKSNTIIHQHRHHAVAGRESRMRTPMMMMMMRTNHHNKKTSAPPKIPMTEDFETSLSGISSDLTSSWKINGLSSHNGISKIFTTTMVVFMISLVGIVVMNPRMSMAASTTTTTTTTFAPPTMTEISKILNHNYDDPLHPQCIRSIQVDRNDPTVFHYKGTRLGISGGRTGGGRAEEGVAIATTASTTTTIRGCRPIDMRQVNDEHIGDVEGRRAVIRREARDGKIIFSSSSSSNSNSHDKIDFKLDLGNGLMGVWEPATIPTAATELVSSSSSLSSSSSSSSSSSLLSTSNSQTLLDGIRWNDGSKWTVQEKPLVTSVGEVIFLAYIGFSTLAGVKGVYDAIQRKRQQQD